MAKGVVVFAMGQGGTVVYNRLNKSHLAKIDPTYNRDIVM